MKAIVNHSNGRSLLYDSTACPAPAFLAEVLADRMAELHLDKHALSALCGEDGHRVCVTTIDTILDGISNPRLETLAALADTLRATITVTFEGPNPHAPGADEG